MSNNDQNFSFRLKSSKKPKKQHTSITSEKQRCIREEIGKILEME